MPGYFATAAMPHSKSCRNSRGKFQPQNRVRTRIGSNPGSTETIHNAVSAAPVRACRGSRCTTFHRSPDNQNQPISARSRQFSPVKNTMPSAERNFSTSAETCLRALYYTCLARQTFAGEKPFCASTLIRTRHQIERLLPLARKLTCALRQDYDVIGRYSAVLN